MTSEFDLWEESIVLINALDEAQAEILAKRIAAESFAYKTLDGSEVRWTFDSIERVYSIEAENLVHGVELFSRFLKPREVESLKEPFEEIECSPEEKSAKARANGTTGSRLDK